MENVVSSRRLRKSMLNDLENYNLSMIDDMQNDTPRNKKNKFKIKFKYKMMVKLFIATLILFTILMAKLVFPDFFINNKYTSSIINEYKNDYSKEYVLENIEKISSNIYTNIKYIIPDNFSNYIKDKYKNKKEYILNFNAINFIKEIIINDRINEASQLSNVEGYAKEIKFENLNGMGGAEPIDNQTGENDSIAVSSAMSIMDSDIEQIKSKNIDIAKPVNGTITSIYGARDEIFEGVNSYHTGLDIANKSGTNILSATDGMVVNTAVNNKYYGNFVEIENDGVIFKYAHMEKINVYKGDRINQGQVIGLMGSTGMSTGPHLHFEIKVNNRTVDPRELVNF